MSFIREVFTMDKREWKICGWIVLSSFVNTIGADVHINHQFVGSIICGIAIVVAFMAGLTTPRKT